MVQKKRRRELVKRGGNFFNICRYEMSSLFCCKTVKNGTLQKRHSAETASSASNKMNSLCSSNLSIHIYTRG